MDQWKSEAVISSSESGTLCGSDQRSAIVNLASHQTGSPGDSSLIPCLDFHRTAVPLGEANGGSLDAKDPLSLSLSVSLSLSLPLPLPLPLPLALPLPLSLSLSLS